MLVSVAKKKPCISFGNLTLLDSSAPPGLFLNFFFGSGPEGSKRKFLKIECSPLPSGLWVFARKPTNRSEGVNIVKNQSVFAHSASKPHKPLGRGENLNFDFLLGAHGAPGGAERYPQAFSKCNFHPSRAVCGFLDTMGTRY